jgi:dephospho-CoA kinase
MRIVGLTGNIAAGKSEVARRLVARGATIIDADLLAREAVTPGSPALAAIVARWGPSALAADGTLDRAALRRIIFADESERAALEAIVHPQVSALRARDVAQARAAGADVVICDIPLLFEAGLEGTVDAIILVDAPLATRRDRLIKRRGLPPAEADAMLAAQWPADQKRARATHIIENDGPLSALDPQIDAIWSALATA